MVVVVNKMVAALLLTLQQHGNLLWRHCGLGWLEQRKSERPTSKTRIDLASFYLADEDSARKHCE